MILLLNRKLLKKQELRSQRSYISLATHYPSDLLMHECEQHDRGHVFKRNSWKIGLIDRSEGRPSKMKV
jgi:hypothetical protein